jgi:hypothetical protein
MNGCFAHPFQPSSVGVDGAKKGEILFLLDEKTSFDHDYFPQNSCKWASRFTKECTRMDMSVSFLCFEPDLSAPRPGHRDGADSNTSTHLKVTLLTELAVLKFESQGQPGYLRPSHQ